MFSNTLHGYPQISTFSLKTEVGTPLGKHPLSLKNQRYAMLLHINNVEYIFCQKSKLHKHHHLSDLFETNTKVHRSLYTPEKSKGPASLAIVETDTWERKDT